jgi:hypothetical protein
MIADISLKQNEGEVHSVLPASSVGTDRFNELKDKEENQRIHKTLMDVFGK